MCVASSVVAMDSAVAVTIVSMCVASSVVAMDPYFAVVILAWLIRFRVLNDPEESEEFNELYVLSGVLPSLISSTIGASRLTRLF